MGRAALLGAIFWITGAAAETSSPLRGLAPMLLDCAGDAELCGEAAACGDCHPDQYTQWQGSMHRAAWNNTVFQHGFARDPKRFCFHCHAPLERDWRRFAAHRGDAKSEGVNCQVCHLAERAPNTKATRTDDHPVRTLADLRDPKFCSQCHEFDLIEEHGGKMHPTNVPLQKTYTEWVRYRDAGGKGTCQSCHMPGGDHRFRGAHDIDFFRGALGFEVVRGATEWQIALSNTGVGHNVPTGDIFRRLVVEHVAKDGRVQSLAVFERVFALRYDAPSDRFRKVLVENRSLRPGQRVEWSLPATVGGHVRVIYYWAGRDFEGSMPQVIHTRSLKAAKD